MGLAIVVPINNTMMSSVTKENLGVAGSLNFARNLGMLRDILSNDDSLCRNESLWEACDDLYRRSGRYFCLWHENHLLLGRSFLYHGVILNSLAHL